ncbi:MAG: TldD/PmbA family protein, partial [Candidatus Hodarchaeota archaeon]
RSPNMKSREGEDMTCELVDLGKEIVSAAEKKDIQQAEAYVLDHTFTTIRFASSQILENKEDHVKGIVLRVLLPEGKIGSAVTTTFSTAARQELIDFAIRSAKTKSPSNYQSFPIPISIECPLQESDLVDPNLWNLNVEKLIEHVAVQIDTAMDLNPAIGSVSGSHNAYLEHYAIVNSNGMEVCTKGTKLSNACTVELEAPSSAEPISGYAWYDGRKLDNFDPEKVATESAEMALRSKNPQKLEPGTYTIVFEPYCFTEILSYCVAYALSGKSIRDKRSYYVDKIGEKVAADHFSLLDDPWLPDGMFSTPVDDEGVVTQSLPMIEKGVLKNYIYDSYSGMKDSRTSTGHGFRRRDFRHTLGVPSITPSNYVLDSSERIKDIISETKNGILVSRVWYVYPINPILGDFTGCGRSGMQLIKDGELTIPLKQFRFFDNVQSLMKNIEGLGTDDVQVSPWFGYSIQAPSIKANNIRIPE